MQVPEKLAAMKDVDLNTLRFLPFQAQIEYKNLKGEKCIRSITESQELTFSKEEANLSVDSDIISVNAVQKTAQLAKQGNYKASLANANNWSKLIQNKAHSYKNYQSNMAPIYAAIEEQQAIQESTNISSSMNYPINTNMYTYPEAAETYSFDTPIQVTPLQIQQPQLPQQPYQLHLEAFPPAISSPQLEQYNHLKQNKGLAAKPRLKAKSPQFASNYDQFPQKYATNKLHKAQVCFCSFCVFFNYSYFCI